MKPKGRQKLTFSRQILLLISLPVLTQIVFLFALNSSFHSLEESYEKEAMASEFLSDMVKFLSDLMNCVSAKVVYHISREERDAQIFDRSYRLLLSQVAPLREKQHRQSRSKQEAEAFDGLMQTLDQSFAQGESAVLSQSQLDTARALLQTRRTLISVNRLYVDLLQDMQNQRRANSSAKLQARHNLLNLITLTFVLNILFLALALVYFNRVTNKKFAQLKNNIISLGLNKPLPSKISGSDEMAELDQILHQTSSVLKQAREQEQALVENALDVILSLDKSMRINRINPAGTRLWQLTEEELLGRSLASLIFEKDRDYLHANLANLSKNNNECSFEIRLESPQGPIDTAFNVRFSDELQTYFCVARDVSKAKELERMRADFMAMISHDLRSPLTSLNLTLEMLESGRLGELPEKAKSRLSRASQSAAHLVELVNDLLEIEKFEVTGINLHISKTESQTLIEQALALVREQAEASRIRLEVRGNNYPVECDPQRIVRVLTNLLTNAIKFSGPGEIVQVITEAGKDSIRIIVSDRGKGIAPDKLGMIFEKYKQIVDESQSDQKGSGLGLPICKAIVEAHGGKIGVKSQVGLGSQFWFTLYMAGN